MMDLYGVLVPVNFITNCIRCPGLLSVFDYFVNWLMFFMSFELRSVIKYFILARYLICVSFIGVSAELNVIVKWNIRLPN